MVHPPSAPVRPPILPVLPEEMQDKRLAILARLQEGDPDILTHLAEAGATNDEKVVAAVFENAVWQVFNRTDADHDEAALQVMRLGLAFLRRFTDESNALIPRRLFPGLVLGLLRLQVGPPQALKEAVAVERDSPFMYPVFAQGDVGVGAEIFQLTQEWAGRHPEAAWEVLGSVKQVAAERGEHHLTLTSEVVVKALRGRLAPH